MFFIPHWLNVNFNGVLNLLRCFLPIVHLELTPWSCMVKNTQKSHLKYFYTLQAASFGWDSAGPVVFGIHDQGFSQLPHWQGTVALNTVVPNINDKWLSAFHEVPKALYNARFQPTHSGGNKQSVVHSNSLEKLCSAKLTWTNFC